MWILDSNGDFLQGKRMWLKPGKKYLFGRVKKDGVRFAIDHKTVSRKHFTITIDAVKDGDVGRIHARTGVVVTDENSKAGTNIDGELLKGKSKELRQTTHSIRPGSCPFELVVTWIPQVLTVSLLKKEVKAGALKDKQERLKELDTKVISDYLSGQTTLLLVGKRNTAKGLQALIEGRSLVAESYIDALVYAATPAALQEEEDLCPLELDFDESWPDPTIHLPPAGKEPTDKPAEAYKPDAERRNVFEKFTFVIFTQQQYDNLMPPITTGHGKALLFEVDPKRTTIEEGLNYMRDIAGHGKQTANMEGGVLLVKYNNDDEPSPLSNFIDKLGSKLNQEPVDQSAFLDAILATDASQLKCPYQRKHNQAQDRRSSTENHMVADTGAQKSPTRTSSSRPDSRPDSALQGTLTAKTELFAHDSTQFEDSTRPRKRARFMQARKNLLDNFDDDFNPDAIGAYDGEEAVEVSLQTQDLQHVRRSGVIVNHSNELIKDELRSTPTTPSQSCSPTNDVDADARMDALFPATAAFRRAKAAADSEARQKGLPGQEVTPSHLASRSRSFKEVKLMDVRATVKAEREKERAEREQAMDEQARFEAEESQFGKGPANLVQIHEYQLPVRDRSLATNDRYYDTGRKPEWEGRKNFKGFRRARDTESTDSGAQPRRKIIVPLVEVGRKTHGIGEEYWDKTQEEKDRLARKKKASQRQSHSQNASRSQRSRTIGSAGDDDDSDHADTTANGAEGEMDTMAAQLQAEAMSITKHPIDLDTPRRTRAHDHDHSAQASATSKPVDGDVYSNKRQASSVPQGRFANAKKQKTLPVVVVDSDSDVVTGRQDGSDSDDMKFAFGLRRGKA